MTKKKNRLKYILQKGSEIGGNVSAALIGLAVAGPAGAIGGAIVGPVLSEIFKKVGNEISTRYLSDREQIRLGATLSIAFKKIEKRLSLGGVMRNDDFFEPQLNDRPAAESILEGTLLKARNEYEEKKIEFYANFLANINFDSSISFEKGNTLLRIIEQLSFRQLTILAYVKKVNVLKASRWMESFHDENAKELFEYQDFYSELLNLYNHQLLKQAGAAIGMSISTFKISPLGNELYTLLELTNIKEEDLDKIQIVVNKIEDLRIK